MNKVYGNKNLGEFRQLSENSQKGNYD